MIKIKNLSKSYKGGNLVLKNVSMNISSTGLDIIVGINGSGKTTFLNSICGLVSINSGEIEIDGNSHTEKKGKEGLFYIPSDFYIPEYLSGAEYASFLFSRYPSYNKEMFEYMAEIFEIKNALSLLTGKYSYGMKKKLQISIAFSVDVQHILADELFNGLDFESYLLAEYAVRLLCKNRKLIIVSHSIDFIKRNPATVFLLNNGVFSPIENVDDIENMVIHEGALKESYEGLERFMDDIKTVVS